jgi:FO synthase
MTKLTNDEALALAGVDMSVLVREAQALRDLGKGQLISYSRKVFIPLTQVCRDVCGYCTFATTPKKLDRAYLSPDQVLQIARAGAAAACREALFTLGDKPELRYSAAREELDALGYKTTVSYLAAMAELVLNETGLLPHINAGVMSAEDMALLRRVSASQGLMLESASERLCASGGPHFGSPDKHPNTRLQMIDAAGEMRIPFTTGILIGIGETRRERIEALFAIRDSHQRYGHIQEVIIQNFRAKPNTRMADALEPSLDELVWTAAVARLIFGEAMNIQVPPNLNRKALKQLIEAGINDWGGVSPVTRDHVNPEAPWPDIAELARETAQSGKTLTERLTIYPDFCLDLEQWVDSGLQARIRAAIEADGFARDGAWSPGSQESAPEFDPSALKANVIPSAGIDKILSRAVVGDDLSEQQIVSLFSARGEDFKAVCAAADDVRKRVNGNVVSYVVTRNINYTNVCYFHCQFCAFSKGKKHEHLRGRAYILDLAEIVRRSSEAWERGATEVCLQGGIHPDYTGNTYINICRAIKKAVPGIHIHAFSPLEVWQGAKTLNIPVSEFLGQLKDAGLNTLPGTAAEILDDEIRRVISPDKVTTQQWLSVIESAHRLGLKTTATIMFGHVERPVHWARHLLHLREIQRRTGGFTELVPLPFVPMESPIYLRGKARRGPTSREALLLHAVARLALHPLVKNIQTSWPKMGRQGAVASLSAGCNDFGGTLMNESISKAAGASNGDELPPREIEALIRNSGRVPLQRTTLYSQAPAERVAASLNAPTLSPLVSSSAIKGKKWNTSLTESRELQPG